MSGIRYHPVRIAASSAMLAWLAACSGRPHSQADLLRTIAQVESSSTEQQSSQVRFRGVVTVANPTFGFFIVQDETAGTRVELSRPMDSALAGHKVEITGNTTLGLGADTIADASVRDLGIGKLPAALRIGAKELGADTFDNKRVTLVGTARLGRVDYSGELMVPVSLGGFEVSVRLVDREIAPEQIVDADIQVTGVASTNVDIEGKLTDVMILVPDRKALAIVRAAPDPASLGVQSVKRVLAEGTDLQHRIRLQGRIQNLGDAAGWQFSDSSGTISIADRVGVNIDQAGPVDLVGFVVRASGGLALRDVRSTFGVNGPRGKTTATKEAVIRSVARLRGLSAEEADSEIGVSLDAVVTYYEPSGGRMFVQDRTGGIYVELDDVKYPALRIGDRVLIQGVSGAGDFAPVVQTPRFQVLQRHASLPVPSSLNTETIFSGLADSQWVELEGIVQSAGTEEDHPFAMLSWGSHEYKVVLPRGVSVPRDWIDVRFKIRGDCGSLFNGKRQLLGIQLFVQGLDQFRRMPESDGARAESGKNAVTTIDKLLQFSPNVTPGHRVHLCGKVLATHALGPTWIRDASGAVAIREHNEIALVSGDIVDVVGFAFPGAFSPEIHEGAISRRASGEPPQPIDVTPNQALFGGVDAQLVRIEGRLITEYRNGPDETLLLRNGRTLFTVRGPGNLPVYDKGTILRLTGICSVSANWSRGAVFPRSFEIVEASPEAVNIVKRAPWLSEQKSLQVLVVTLLLIAAGLVWVFVLRRQVGGQTRLIEQKLLEVEKLKEKAEAASEAKSQFLANMSHEIRTPMNGILGMTELAMQAESAEEQKECLSTLRSSGDALLAILNDLLDLSKIEAGKFEIEEEPFSVRELVADAGKMFTYRMREKGLRFESTVVDSLPDVLLGDALRLRQILLNLLGNAVKFTQEGSVWLTAAGERDGDRFQLRLVVRDSGIGIPLEKQGRIFEAFRQADDATARKYGGTGLGLSICVKLVTLMGGKIAVDSEPGQGSAFSIHLLLKEAPPQDQVAIAPQDSSMVANVVTPLKILLAEDNLVNQIVAARLLKKQGHEVTIAGDGKLAVEEFERGAFDLILMDVQMPVMDGLDATREIRLLERGHNARVPIIAMTAQTMKGDRDNCFAAGMDGFVSKPIRLPELWAAINVVKAPAIR
jgi:signal transduction histidine kinase/CheY-like chemotaxis protein